MSRNRQRKAAYADQADKSSRNEATIVDKPIIHDGDAIMKSVSVLVHQARASTAKVRRQEAAWSRCLVKNKEHDFTGERNGRLIYRSDRCIACGCPESEAKKEI